MDHEELTHSCNFSVSSIFPKHFTHESDGTGALLRGKNRDSLAAGTLSLAEGRVSLPA